MRRTRFDTETCPIARVTDLLGDWWMPLVMRELLYGRNRFDDIQRRLGVSRAVLTERLRRLEDEGVLERVPYQSNPVRYDYRPTEKGEAAWNVLAALWTYGSDWFFAGEGGPPGELYDTGTGETVEPVVVDRRTGAPISPATTRIRSRTG